MKYDANLKESIVNQFSLNKGFVIVQIAWFTTQLLRNLMLPAMN